MPSSPEIRCPLCGSRRATLIFTEKSGGRWRCGDCGALYDESE